MKTEMLYGRLSERRSPAPIERLLIDKPLGSLLGDSFLSSFNNSMQETPDGYTLEIAVPGMKKKHLKLEIADGVLTVQGQKQQQDVLGWASKTTSFKSTRFYRTFMLPQDADGNGIKAKCRNGLLKISIPKIESQRSFRNIPIAPAEDTGQMNWWRKFTRLLKRLKTKVNYRKKRLGFGSKRKKILPA